MDIVQERLEREYDLTLLATSPSVSYRVKKLDTSTEYIESPSKLPHQQDIDEIHEPWLDLRVITPANHIGAVMELVRDRRGEYGRMEYLQTEGLSDNNDASLGPRVLLEYKVPLAEVLVEFYDQLKARTQGYASMDYNFSDYLPGDLVRITILVNGDPVDALSVISH